MTVTQRIKLNDVGNSNGQYILLYRSCSRQTRKRLTFSGYTCTGVNETGAIEIFVDGVSKLNVQGIELRTRGDSVFRGIQAQTFFG